MFVMMKNQPLIDMNRIDLNFLANFKCKNGFKFDFVNIWHEY